MLTILSPGGMYPQWFVYMVRCQNGAIYTGITNNLSKRIDKHNLGKGSKSCRAHGLPVKLECVILQWSKSDALKLEARIKKLSKKHKEQFIKAAKSDSDENPVERQFMPRYKSCMAMNSLFDQKNDLDGLRLYIEVKLKMMSF